MPLARRLLPFAVVSTFAVLVAACGTAPKKPSPSSAAPASAPSAKYYKDDGPGLDVPANLDAIADAVPRPEPLHRFANRPYMVFGRDYVPATSLRPYKERGIASWYGRKFHGEKTANGETYDMYAMSAAHPTLPLPSYARVTNVATGRSVVVRVNDRGPFLHGRVIDLSYAAAHRIGVAQTGSGEVEVEAILPGTAAMTAALPLPPVVTTPAAAGSAPVGSGTAAAPAIVGAPPPAAALAQPPSALAPSPVAPTTAVATAAASDASAPGPVTSADGGFVVQLGAFASNANAENFVAHLANQLAPAGVEPKIRQVNGLFRVFVGPYAARDDARRTADRLRDALGLPSVIAVH